MTDIAHNPLYHPPAIPDFAHIEAKHAIAIEHIVHENQKALTQLLAQHDFTWDNLIQPLDRMDNRLARAFSPIRHLHCVTSTKEWRAAYQKALAAVSEYETEQVFNKPLYQAIKSIRSNPSFSSLSNAQQKAIVNKLEHFERNGVNLPPEQQNQLRAIIHQLDDSSTQFANNLLDSTQAWHLLINDEKILDGIPENIKHLMALRAKKHQQQGWRITLDAPILQPLLAYAHNRELRKTVLSANNACASDLCENVAIDNGILIEKIRTLRQQQATILGFPDYAALSTDSKMAKTTQTVINFLEQLLQASMPMAIEDMATLRQFAAEKLGIEDVEAWDIPYITEKMRYDKFALTQEDLRPYFPISTVLQGLFSIVHKLFNINIQPNTEISTWHHDVLTYTISDHNHQPLAYFYLDLYARDNKRSGAWMDFAAHRFYDNDQMQLPVAYMTCNFTPPLENEEACLTHRQIITLFHEFGHGLHHMLSEVNIYAISGMNNVEWDAVEQPSQFMENFCYTREGIQILSCHRDTGKKLPNELFDKLITAKNFQSAMETLRHIEYALYDFHIHMHTYRNKLPLEILQQVHNEVAVTPAIPNNRFPMQFLHIFAAQYAAGYYSYKWAEVMSADSFSAFEEEGLFNPETGSRFRKEILASAGSRSSLESFIAFRGRKPKLDALLRHSGIL